MNLRADQFRELIESVTIGIERLAKDRERLRGEISFRLNRVSDSFQTIHFSDPPLDNVCLCQPLPNLFPRSRYNLSLLCLNRLPYRLALQKLVGRLSRVLVFGHSCGSAAAAVPLISGDKRQFLRA